MTIETAIKDLEARIGGQVYPLGLDDCDDLRLAIQALKSAQVVRTGNTARAMHPLPGETTE